MRRALNCVLLVCVVVLGVASGARSAAAAATPLACPTTSVSLTAGTYSITGACTLKGNITLASTASLTIDTSTFVLDGDISLGGDAQLVIRKSTFTIANHFAFEHTITAKNRSVLHFIDSTLVTTAGAVTTSLPVQYQGSETSLLWAENSKIQSQQSWLVVDLVGQATLHRVASTVPSGVYPHESSTVTVEGGSELRVWLEFLSGSKATVANIPDAETPFTFHFGRNTAGTVNIGYQIDVVSSVVRFGVLSHPGSDVTIQNNVGEITVGYLLLNVTSASSITSVTPITTNLTLTDQGRTFRLVNAKLEPYGWHVYSAAPGVTSAPLVGIGSSVINELAALDGGRFTLDSSVVQFAMVAAIGPDSSIRVKDSIIHAQTIMGEKNSTVQVEDSQIFGSLVQARDDARITLLNSTLGKNVCHALCIPGCDPNGTGGCNVFNDPLVDTRLVADGRASIVVAGIDWITRVIKIGETYAIKGDALIQAGADATRPYTYDLSFRKSTATTWTS